MYYTHNDHLATPQVLTDSNATIVWSGEQDPFGEVTIDAGSSVTNNLRFPGQYYDSETGLHYNWHRYYDSATGRYNRVDDFNFAFLGTQRKEDTRLSVILIEALFDPGLTNPPFQYSNQNPLINFDILGFWKSSGHKDLTKNAMKARGYDDAAIAAVIEGNLSNDYFSGQIFSAWHHMPRSEQCSEDAIFDSLERAIDLARIGELDLSYSFLGHALHIVQDKYAHSAQGAGWLAHVKELYSRGPDDPIAHSSEYSDAYADTQFFLDLYHEGVNR